MGDVNGKGVEPEPTKSDDKKSNYVPDRMDRFLQSLDFNSEEHLLLGCSNLTSGDWIGSIWYFQKTEEAPDVSKCLTGLELDFGFSEAKFFGNDKKLIVVGMDDGGIEAYTLSWNKEMNMTFPFLEQIRGVQCHHDVITGLSEISDKSGLISCSYDKTIVHMDLNSYVKAKEYTNPHSDLILSLDTHPMDSHLFATSSQDGKAAVWDLRKNECSETIFDNINDAPSCVKFVPNETNLVLLGKTTGEIGVVDIRNPSDLLDSNIKASRSPIYKFQFSEKNPDTFALASDSSMVRICHIDCNGKISLKYSDCKSHTDFVRGLSWHPKNDILWACGWDKKITRHQLS